eukprot:s6437_g2.t1
MSGALQSLRYSRTGGLEVLDQLKVPQSKHYAPVKNAEDAWPPGSLASTIGVVAGVSQFCNVLARLFSSSNFSIRESLAKALTPKRPRKAVRSMQVRGAPLIAMVSALGLAVEAAQRAKDPPAEESPCCTLGSFRKQRSYLRTSRPTAVNLSNAMEALEEVVNTAVQSGSQAAQVYEAYVCAAERMLEEDVAANKAIGEAGADAILAAMQALRASGEAGGRGDSKARVLTICNTGSLATAGWGTALGVIRSLHARGRLERAFACETRWYNQGARLTAFERLGNSMTVEALLRQ